jgi:hypothetical protein
MAVLIAFLLVAVLLFCWALTVFGMPGNWLMVATAAVYVYFLPATSPVAIDWKIVVSLLVLAGLGELLELLAGAAGAAKAGASRRSALLALVGSTLGGLLGVFVGMPIPLVGSIVAALLFAGLGAMAGAVLGEIWVGNRGDATWQIGKAAFWGRILGTLSKMLVGAVMLAVVIVALIV